MRWKQIGKIKQRSVQEHKRRRDTNVRYTGTFMTGKQFPASVTPILASKNARNCFLCLFTIAVSQDIPYRIKYDTLSLRNSTSLTLVSSLLKKLVPKLWTSLPPTTKGRDFHEKLIVIKLVKKFPTFYINQRVITIFTRA